MQIKLLNITFKGDRAQIDVQFNGKLSPDVHNNFIKLLLKKYPSIAGHSCRNSKGPTFGDCVETTSVAHIFEHVILEELKEATSHCKIVPSIRAGALTQNDVRVFVAKTSNLGDGLAKIELKYYDDILTLQAINRGADSLNQMLAGCERQERL